MNYTYLLGVDAIITQCKENNFFVKLHNNSLDKTLAQFSFLIAAIVFSMAHYASGAKYIVLATVAGMGNGQVYLTTKRVEESIFTHFGLKLTHFLFFTYPALVGVI